MLNLILAGFSIFLSSAAFAQNEMAFNTEEGKYGEERTRGDLAAEKSRSAFELEVCRKSVKVFCPSKDADALDSLKACRDEQLDCGAMYTSVATRFISKYGKGADSANKVALPAIEQVLAAFQDFRFGGLHRRETVNAIAKFSGEDPKKVQRLLIDFISHYDSKRPPLLVVDFWGYFQQWATQRPQVTYREDGTLDTVTISFRFCGMPLAFVSEPNFGRDVLAQAIFSEAQLPGLTTADQYAISCDLLEKQWRASKK